MTKQTKVQSQTASQEAPATESKQMAPKFIPQTVNVYCCGGTGTNIGVLYQSMMKDRVVGMADLKFIYIDTSKSNVRSSIPDEAFYLIKNQDTKKEGSGKIRLENADPIMDSAEHILEQYPPAFINIVIGSMSGGSGSVIGPALTQQLLKQDKVVFTAVVASTDTRVELENSIKTLQSYEKVARTAKRPVPAYYQVNSSHDYKEVDESITWYITTVAIIAGALGIEGSGLDSADVYNLVNYQRFNSAQPQLTRIHMWYGISPTVASMSDDVMSMLLVTGPDSPPVSNIRPDYRATATIHQDGLASEYPFASINTEGPLGVYLINGGFNETFEEFSKLLKEIDARRRTQKVSSSLLGSDSGENDGKLVF